MSEREALVDEYRQYQRKQIAEMADWHPGFDMTGVSVSDADRQAGSPKIGDKIARNPKNHADKWLVAADYFTDNFAALNAPQHEPVAHPDDAAIDKFAAAMKAKMAKKRAEGRSGWDDPEQCTIDYLTRLFHDHVRKGDPVDIGNFAMMLWHRISATSLPALPKGDEQ